jgi:hypothetical protein
MIVNGIDLIVWCIGATAEAVVCVNTSDVPVHCAVNISVFYVTFTHFMPNICSPVVRKETDKVLSPNVFEMLESVAVSFPALPLPPHFTELHTVGCWWHQAISDAIVSKVKYFCHHQFMQF